MAGFDLDVSLSRSVRKFFQVIRIEKKEVSSIYFYAILSGLIQLSLPLGIQAIINFAQAAAGRGKLPASMWLLTVLVVSGVFITGLLQVNQMRLVEKIQQRIFSRYAFEFSYQIPKLKTSEIEKYYLPELVNRFFDSVSLQKSLAKLLLDIPLAIIQILFGLILLSVYNSIFILLGLLLLICILLVLYFSAPRGLKASLEESNYKYSLMGWIEELARGFKTFKVSNSHHLHLKKTDQLLEGYLEARTDHFNVLKFQYWSLIVFKLLITASMLVIGGILLIDQRLNVGQFIAAEIVIITVLAAVEKIILSLDKVYDVLTSLEKLSKVTDKDIEMSGDLLIPDDQNAISVEAKNISFSFEPGKEVLKNISFNIPAGNKVCIMGGTSSGRSTLMELATGSLQLQAGSLLINDIPIGNYNLMAYRKNIGVFYNEQDIFQASLLDNITMGNSEITQQRLMELAEVIGIKDFIVSLPQGFNTMLSPTGKGLSTIIKQKILLLRAFSSSPKMLLMDEPFEMAGGLHTQKICSYLLGMKNTTVVVVTNNIDFAKGADELMYMEAGKIKFSGSPDVVLKKLEGTNE
jgi:ABC-type bacteriocin/lantibiotic exporter with double-glycine peptidase domain